MPDVTTPQTEPVKKAAPVSLPKRKPEQGPSGPLQELSRSPKWRLNSLLTTILSAMLLAFLGFVAVQLPNPGYVLDYLFTREIGRIDYTLMYTFQIPFAVFIGAFLGRRLGLLAMGLFITTGLFFLPVFSGGGGLQYVSQPGFGYIVGMAAGAWLAGRYIDKVFTKVRWGIRSLLLIGLSIAAVALVHLTGTLGLLVDALAGQITFREMGHWWMTLTADMLLYDIIAATTMLLLVRFFRMAMWLALY